MKIRGGIARKNGVTFISDRFTVTATRQKNGCIYLEAKELHKSSNGILNKADEMLSSVPFVRGIWGWLQIMLQNWKFPLTIILLNIPLFILNSTSKLQNMEGRLSDSLWIFLILTLIMLVKLTPLGKYHAAEHQAANSYKKNRRITLDEVRTSSRIHEQCGTNLVIFSLTIAFSVLSLININAFFAALIGLSVGTEIHFNTNKVVRKLLLPFYVLGYLIQFFIFTSKPSDPHLKVAIECLEKLKRLDTERQI